MSNIKLKVKPNYKNLPNEFHLHIQTKYRALIQDDKTKYKRCRDKRNVKKEIRDNL